MVQVACAEHAFTHHAVNARAAIKPMWRNFLELKAVLLPVEITMGSQSELE